MKQKEHINIEESNAIKTIALLLVIWGHNHYLTPLGTPFLYWLYDFHVAVFFILPCFYKSREENFFPFLNKLTIRCIIPYTFFYFISLCVSLLFHKIDNIDFDVLVKGYFHFCGVTTDDAVGFQFVWFLPAFYIFSVIRYWGSNNKYINSVIIIIGLYIIVVGDDKRAIIYKESPLYISQAIYFYTLGVGVYHFNRLILYSKYIACFLFLVSSYAFMCNRFMYDDVIVTMTGFFVIWIIAHFLYKISIIQKIGGKSLIIYLVHIYFYCILDVFMPKSLIPQLIVFIFTVSTAYITSIIFDKKSTLKNIIFPRDMGDLKTLFCKS